MKKLGFLLFTALLSACAPCKEEHVKNELRAPAYPLITIDPYTSTWSAADKLYDAPTTHWTGAQHHLLGVITVDGQSYRFLGEKPVEKKYIARISDKKGWAASYTMKKPAGKWMNRDYNDSKWSVGEGAFGSATKKPMVHTVWDGPEIWVRRSFELDAPLPSNELEMFVCTNDYGTIYLNGIKICDSGKTEGTYLPLPEEAVKSLKVGKNVIAAYCANPSGSAKLDVGLDVLIRAEETFEQTAEQLYADVQATQTHYGFQCGPVELSLSFMAPLFMEDLDLLSRPVNYMSYQVKSLDGAKHDVQLMLEATPSWAVHIYGNEATTSETYTKNGLTYLKASSVEQDILGKQGDDDRINWGSFYMVAEEKNTTASVEDNGYMKFVRDLGATKSACGKFMIGYDDLYSVQYFGENLRPYWNRNGDKTIESQFERANKEYKKLVRKAYAFDRQLMEEATEAGGKQYAELCALAYRQAITAHKLVQTREGFLAFLSKENNSNGSIGTVDVTYPSLPIFLKYNPELAKGLMNHIFHYSECGRWNKPFPAHDVGTYPWANGQTYPYDMPVEEAGNMLIGAAAVCYYEKSPAYAREHWEVMSTWVDYLCEFGLDPENQLCTDDFAGHFAHNANLSIKAIVGIASYAKMADMLGQSELSDKYFSIAKGLAKEWKTMSQEGDHYKLTFDRANTWSQKYNLVWDELLDLDLFDDDIMDAEIPYYLGKQNTYGLPLDCRSSYTKSDWIMWTATMADSDEDFERFVAPVWKFYNETIDRVPMSDWFYTDKPEFCMFIARSVVGGYFIKMLEEKDNN
jgi:hypothetical protein